MKFCSLRHWTRAPRLSLSLSVRSARNTTLRSHYHDAVALLRDNKSEYFHALVIGGPAALWLTEP